MATPFALRVTCRSKSGMGRMKNQEIIGQKTEKSQNRLVIDYISVYLPRFVKKQHSKRWQSEKQ